VKCRRHPRITELNAPADHGNTSRCSALSQRPCQRREPCLAKRTIGKVYKRRRKTTVIRFNCYLVNLFLEFGSVSAPPNCSPASSWVESLLDPPCGAGKTKLSTAADVPCCIVRGAAHEARRIRSKLAQYRFFHGCRFSSSTNTPTTCAPDPSIWRGAFCQRSASVLGTTSNREDVIATVGRRPSSLEYLHGVLSGVVASRLCVCGLRFPASQSEIPGHPSSAVISCSRILSSIRGVKPRSEYIIRAE
jgi:hypothetical protein